VTCWDPLLVPFPFPYICYFCLILIFLSSGTLLAAKGFYLGAYALRSDPCLTALKQKKHLSPQAPENRPSWGFGSRKGYVIQMHR